jgi:protoheme IX farnesyltransferase
MSLQASPATPATGAPATRRARIADFYQLTKPGITRHVVLTTAVGFYMAAAAGGLDWILFLHTLLGTMLVSSGTMALNHYAERNIDGLMRRTAGRPLPARRLTPEAALLFASATALGGIAYLALLVNGTAALITAATLVSYIFIYTPLKRRSSLNTLVGAVPGALPILAGWTAAGRTVDLPGTILFAIMFLWQIPHFLALAWLYREDYRAGGFVMLSKHDPDGRKTSRQIANYAAMLLPVSLLPSAIGIAGRLYFAGALLLGVAFLVIAFGTLTRRDELWWKRLFITSVVYLPLLFLLMVIDKTG